MAYSVYQKDNNLINVKPWGTAAPAPVVTAPVVPVPKPVAKPTATPAPQPQWSQAYLDAQAAQDAKDRANALAISMKEGVPGAYSGNKIVSGTTDVRNGEAVVKNDAAGTANDIANLDLNTTIADIKAAIGYRDPNAPFNESELKNIEQAGAAAGAEYDPEIQKAEEARRQGLPRAVVGAGERGGFMNTQFSGATANPLRDAAQKKIQELQAIGMSIEGQPMVDWIGAGGELSNIKSEYDRNINNLNDAKLRAIALAKSKAQEAIRTGKASDNQAAQELFKLAQQANEQVLNIAQKKVDLIASYDKAQQAKITYNTDKINDLASVDQPLDDATRSATDAIYGAGWADKYYELAKKVTSASQVSDQVKNMKEIYDLMEQVPVGTKKTFGDVTYEGQYSPKKDESVYKITTKTGEVALLTYNKNTGTVKTVMTGTKERISGGGVSAKSYFTVPIEGGKTEYLYGDPKNPADAQKITQKQYLAGSSLAQAYQGVDITQQEFLDSIKEQAANANASGQSKEDFIADFKKANGEYPNAEETAIIDDAYQSWFGGVWNAIIGQ